MPSCVAQIHLFIGVLLITIIFRCFYFDDHFTLVCLSLDVHRYRLCGVDLTLSEEVGLDVHVPTLTETLIMWTYI